MPEGWQDRVDEDTLVCRCEEVPAGALRRGNAELVAEDLRAQKGVTRAGMGWCQGRVCGFAVACMSASDPADSLRTSAKRPVAQPVPLAALRDLPEV
ncbi:hypothetical protein [Leucobacter coleopterorum]|uniref:hypothetical protein n=1 Tax=Leucobacter coleopterorum TaxID=2714933 RepID=UPI001980A4BA|nr:hypothetical protein [Leucobacter coleopterorum]